MTFFGMAINGPRDGEFVSKNIGQFSALDASGRPVDYKHMSIHGADFWVMPGTTPQEVLLQLAANYSGKAG